MQIPYIEINERMFRQDLKSHIELFPWLNIFHEYNTNNLFHLSKLQIYAYLWELFVLI